MLLLTALKSSTTAPCQTYPRGGIEEQQLEHLVALLNFVILSNSNDRWVSDLNDRWVTDLNGDGVFRVKDVRNLLDEFFLPRADVPMRWVKNIPIKVNIFAWKLALDRLPTRANLVQRNVVTESQSCPLCDAILEDTSHLFFNCSLARDVTRLLCRWWNLGVQTFSSNAEWLVWFNSVRLASNLKVILKGVFYVTWWSLWNFRNQLLFASKKPRKESIFDDIALLYSVSTDEAEREQWLDMLSMLGTVTLSSSIDRWVCDINGEGEFRVKDIRSSLDDILLPSTDVATRWVKFIPIKINVFAWRARLDRLPTRCGGISLGATFRPLPIDVIDPSLGSVG
ncbi:RNA-directed DNA polymerase, eukaryota [Tanacetum coccineum]